MPLLRTVLGLSLALAATVVLVLVVASVDRVVVAAGRLAGGTSPVRTPIAGIVAEVFTRAGEEVRHGEPLLRLETAALETSRRESLARIAHFEESATNLEAEARLLAEHVHPAEVSQSTHGIERARLLLVSSSERAALLKRLEGGGLTNALEVEDAELRRRLAELSLLESSEACDLLLQRQRGRLQAIEGELRELVTQIDGERAALTETERLLDQSTIESEQSGVVVGRALEELVGRSVAAGEELLRVAHAPPSRFEASMQDKARSLAARGAPAKIRLLGYPWLLHGVLEGEVEFVSERRDREGGFPVTVTLGAAEDPGPLYEGMTGEARIVVEQDVSVGRLLIERLIGPFDP